MSKFSQLQEPERMVFVAKLFHNMWYDDTFYADVEKLMKKWEGKDIREAVFFPEHLFDDEQK